MTADSDGAEPGVAPDGCLDLAALDALAAGAVSPGSPAEVHLRSCDRCRDLLDEMRNANRFLDRFKSAVSRDSPPRPSVRATGLPSDSATIRIRGYQVQHVLAFGGQGAVYRAVQAGTGRAVAIKVPLGDSQRRPSIRYRFEREIELTAKLDHPAIVRVFGACELDDGRVGCVMECIEGQRFDAWAEAQRAEGRVSVRDIVEAAVKIVDAISFAHQRGVLHRDIKPSNVIVTAEDSPHVLDFGLAKALGDSKQSFETLTGAFVGTLAYAAPEQIIEGSDAVDIRTDVYAIGLLLYQALTGRLPYDADTSAVELLRQIRELPPPLPSSLSSAIDDDLDAILLMALAKEKDRRYAAAAELRDDLVAWLEGRAVRARLDSRWYAVRKAVRRHRIPIAIAAASFVALGATTTLALIAREQANRANLADAVRDPRVLESHWARLAEARATALDNFEAGERQVWDALLDPHPALLKEGIEGLGAGKAAVPSPAYWALWEIYQRNPVLFTAPSTDRQLATLDLADGSLITVRPDAHRLDWWDHGTHAHLRTLDVPQLAGALGLSVSSDGTHGISTGAGLLPSLIDFETGGVTTLQDSAPAQSVITSDTRAIVINVDSPSKFRAMLWDLTTEPPKPIAGHSFESQVRSVLFDASGQAFAVTSEKGQVLIARADDGSAIYSRDGQEPRYIAVHSRGVPGEFIVYGPEMIAVVEIEDPQHGFDNARPRTGFLEGVRAISANAAADRYVITTDRMRVGIGDKTLPHTRGTMLPALSAHVLAINAEASFVAARMRPSGRASIVDVASAAPRRLPVPAETTDAGFATVFDVDFDPSGQQLAIAAMDGSLRTFDIVSAEPLHSTTPLPGLGLTAVRQTPDATFATTHDMELRNAAVVRMDEAGSHILLEGRGWICALEAEPNTALWVLTGDNQLFKLNPNTGEQLAHVTLPRHSEATTRTLARIPSLGLLLVGPADGGIAILDENTLEAVASPAATGALRHIAISPADPTLVATAGDDGRVTLWRLEPGPTPRLRPLETFGAHAGAIFTLGFSPDGTLLATGGGSPESKDVRLWDVQRRRELATFSLFELGVFDVAFSPDGRWLAAGGEVRLDHPEEGGQVFLIDLTSPDRCIAGNLEYHIARFARDHGREPSQADTLRRWAAAVRERAR